MNDLKETIEALRLQSRSHVAFSSGGGGSNAGGGGTGGGSGTSLTRQSIDQMKDSTCSGIYGNCLTVGYCHLQQTAFSCHVGNAIENCESSCMQEAVN